MKTSERNAMSESEVNERETFTHYVTIDTDSLSRKVSNKIIYFCFQRK
jgi:hypothetical protein